MCFSTNQQYTHVGDFARFDHIFKNYQLKNGAGIQAVKSTKQEIAMQHSTLALNKMLFINMPREGFSNTCCNTKN